MDRKMECHLPSKLSSTRDQYIRSTLYSRAISDALAALRKNWKELSFECLIVHTVIDWNQMLVNSPAKLAKMVEGLC